MSVSMEAAWFSTDPVLGGYQRAKFAAIFELLCSVEERWLQRPLSEGERAAIALRIATKRVDDSRK